MSVKEAAHPAIEALPDTASLPDAADRVALLAALEKGRHAVREGRWRSPEEVEKLLSSWLEKQSGRTREAEREKPNGKKPNGVRLWGLGSVRVFGSGSYQAPASTPSLCG
jgi:hypothetical protein